jgi:16S rRNA processing protein RimM
MGEDSKLYIGRIAKEFGADGELQINLSSEYSIEENIKEPVYVEIDGIPVPLFFKSFRTRGKDKALAIFDDFESSPLASRLIGLSMFVKQEEEEEAEDEMGLDLFVGFTVIDHDLGRLGTIVDFHDISGNPLFVVDHNGTEILIPVNEDLIVKVSEKKREITFDLPTGLIELN